MTTELETEVSPELLHSLLAWCYIHQHEIPHYFYQYARDVHFQKHTAYSYEKPHRLYGLRSDSRLQAALVILLEGGVGCLWLEDGNEWRPGKQIAIMGLEEAHYFAFFSFVDDTKGAAWAAGCGCEDFRPHRLCKHCIAAWVLSFSFYQLHGLREIKNG